MRAGRFNPVEFFPEQPDEMGLWSKGVVPPLRVVGEADQYIKRGHEHSFHAGNASGRVPEKSRKSICTEFLVGTASPAAALWPYTFNQNLPGMLF